MSMSIGLVSRNQRPPVDFDTYLVACAIWADASERPRSTFRSGSYPSSVNVAKPPGEEILPRTNSMNLFEDLCRPTLFEERPSTNTRTPAA